ncbi:ABC transporter G family member 23 [Folsomia candida]|uniref:ABC transporter G family member 23 n=1 Tax=Folsomia candida TaxID=158441 RepID=A0A226DY73_FOLCA|nr:ABC transporter G family member 23 [Folsomia candida]
MAQLQRVTTLSFSDACIHQKESEAEIIMDKLPPTTTGENGYINPAFNGVPPVPTIIMEEGPFETKDHTEITLNGNGFTSLPAYVRDDDAVAAVVVVNACKSFTHGAKSRPVLDNFCMTVKQGTIYSLLGSSGCGKTTLLTAVVGMKHLDSGRILIFGSKTGTVASGVPGKRIGYMPQETALYGDFNIRETLTYFGSLYGMKKSQIDKSREVLMNLLSLPEETRRISTLSGGQKRRVSLAVSLIHSPSLLILDEPTVGVDPVLRDNIWQHLQKMVSNGHTTVIITTHYIGEATHSNTVGVMRGGRLLTEKSPKALFDEYKTQNLEEVVLKICHDDERDSLGYGRSRSKSGNILKVTVDRRYSHPAKKRASICNNNPGGGEFGAAWYKAPTCLESMFDSFSRVKSLIMKNAFVMLRNIFLVLFVVLLPAMQTVVMGMSMGNDPRPIKVGVVNYDYEGECTLKPVNLTGDNCEVANLSCMYLSTLPLDTIQLSYYHDEESARNDIKLGTIKSFMTFLEGYSTAMYERSVSSVSIDNETLQTSMILFEMDASNAVVTKSLQKIVFESYKTFVQGLLLNCGLNPELGGLPIKFQNPIYGRYDLELREYVAAGMLVGDKKQGTLERARVAGTQTWEIMLSYFATEGIVLCMQTLASFLILIFIFKITIVGSSYLAVLLILLNGFAGISLGLLIASFCKEEIQGILLAMAIIFPNFFLAGSIWPVEGMPIILQYVSYGLPGTLACEAFRSIVVRGWGFSHIYVWTGFLSTFAWVCLYWILGIFVHKVTLRKN